MAVAAFKSTSRRTQIGPQDSGSTSSAKGKSDVHSQKGVHRRTGSLSDISRHFPEISSSADSFLAGQIDAGSRRDNPLFQTTISAQDCNSDLSDFRNTLRRSRLPESSSTFLQASKEDARSRRGRSLSRSQADGANGCLSEAKHEQRRGRSVSRHQAIDSQTLLNQKVCQADIGRRGRSLSRCKYDDSESDMETAYNGIGRHRLNNLSITDGQKYGLDKAASVVPTCQQGLRRCSSPQSAPQSLEGYSSCVSALTDDEESAMHPDVRVEEKTIRAVYEQMKTLRSDYPTGDVNAVGLYEAMRSEVRRAVAEIRFDLEQAISKQKLSSTTNNDCNDLKFESNSGNVKAVDDIRNEYAAKLEQSEKRARDLWAQLAVEEQRCQELARIVEELLPCSQLSQSRKTSRTRKNSAERKRMSKRLTEEAENYIDEFVSMSKLEDSEISSLEEIHNDSPTHGIKAEEKGSCQASIQDISHNDVADSSTYSSGVRVLSESDGVVLPWLKWETNSHNSTQRNSKKLETAETGKGVQQSLDKKKGSHGNYGSCWSNSLHATSGKGSNGDRSTDNSRLRNVSGFNISSTKNIVSSTWNSGERRARKHDYGTEKNTSSFKKVTEEGSMKSVLVRSGYQVDEFLLHAHNEDILIEKMKLKNRIDSGGLLLCGGLLL